MAAEQKHRPHDSVRWLLVIGFGMAIFFVPLLQLVSELLSDAPIQELDLFKRPPTIPHLRSYEHTLEDQSVVSKSVRMQTQRWLTAALKRGNEKVVLGRDGWLFYRLSVDDIVAPSLTTLEQAERAIIAFRDTLQAQRVDLLLLPMPGKATIYPEYLSSRYDETWGPARNRYASGFFDSLDVAGIAYLDPTDLLWQAKSVGTGPLYIPQETHWSPRGMRLIAQALAERVCKSDRTIRPEQRVYRLETLHVEHFGDIYDMLQLPERGVPQFEPYSIDVQRVIEAETGQPVEPASGSPILFLGDSFTNIFSRSEMGWGDHAGISERLAFELGMPLDVIAENGGGTTGTRATLARRSDALVGKRLVIWQFAMRDLVSSEAEWKIVDIPPAEVTSPAEVPEAPASDQLVVTGEILLVSEVPNPFDVPYTECLTFLKYRVISVEQGTYAEDVLIAVFWGMQGAELRPAARFVKGEKHRLTLEPLAKHPDLDPIMRADDTEDYELTPMWVLEWQTL